MNFDRCCPARNVVPRSQLRCSVLAACLMVVGMLACKSAASVPLQGEGALIEHLNLPKQKLALDGYDPVAYFPEGGGKASKGDKKLTVNLRGVTYRFSNKKNRALFLDSPEQFEPDYGGWCAWAMANGEKVEVDPRSFLIEDGRLLVFYDGLFSDTRKSWGKKGGQTLRPVADRQWGKIIGEQNGPIEDARESGTGLAFEGKDPITRRSEGGSKPGLETIVTHIGGMQYRFQSEQNRLAFLHNPESFLGNPKR